MIYVGLFHRQSFNQTKDTINQITVELFEAVSIFILSCTAIAFSIHTNKQPLHSKDLSVCIQTIQLFKLICMDHRSSQQLQLEALNHKSELGRHDKHPSEYTNTKFVSLLKVAAVFFFAFMLYKMTERVYSVSERNHDMEQLLKAYDQAVSTLHNKLEGYSTGIPDPFTEEDQQKFRLLSRQIKSLQKQTSGDKNAAQEGTADPGLLQIVQEFEEKVSDREVVINLLLAHSKEHIRQKKIAMMEKIGKKQQFQVEKIRNPWALSKINLKTPYIDTLERRHMEEELQKESERLEADYHLSLYQTQIPLCVIVPTRNNGKNYRYQYNLQSIVNQDYSNYKVVIIDDASTDGTPDLIKAFIRRSKVPHSRFELIINQQRQTAVPNINKAIRNHCGKDDVALLVSGDDELLGKKVFKLLNAVYQSKKAGMVYTNHFFGKLHENDFEKGYSRAYSIPEIKNKNYRFIGQKFGHMRTFPVSLFLDIKDEHMKYRNGTWIQATYDQTFVLPILEMACDSIEYVDEFVYLYNYGTGENDGEIHHDLQSEAAVYVRQLPRYECVSKYAKYAI